MGRTADPRNAVWTIGHVRVVAQPPASRKRGYRILWSEHGRQRERTATDLERAKAIAIEVESDSPVPSSGGVTFGQLLTAHFDAKADVWSSHWTEGQEIILTRQLDHLGDLPVASVTSDHLNAYLIGLRDGTLVDPGNVRDSGRPTRGIGYSQSAIGHERKFLLAAVKRGVNLGIWTLATSPGNDVQQPPATGILRDGGLQPGVSDGPPDKALIPTDEQVEAFIASAAEYSEQYRVISTIAAYTGIRWGELRALSTDAVDTQQGVLNLQYAIEETGSGIIYKRITAKKGGPRTVVCGEVVDELEAWIAQLPASIPAGPRVLSDRPPGCPLFYNRNSNPLGSSFHSTVVRRIIDNIDPAVGWPRGARFHYLRHFAATRFVRMGISVNLIAKQLGHTTAATTWDWYVGTDEQALAQFSAELVAGRARLRSSP